MLARNVDLVQARKNLVFPEGGMCVFYVGDFGIADVPSINSISGTINSNRDGFTATWDAVEHADGYECYIRPYNSSTTIPATATSNGDGTWSATVSGLSPDTYYFFARPIPEDGHELESSMYSEAEIHVGVPRVWYFAHAAYNDREWIENTEYEYIIDFSPGKVRYTNLTTTYDEAWHALKATGEWFFYSTEPLEQVHSIELWSKDDSHNKFKVYASSTPGAESVELTGTVVEVSEINTQIYSHVHKRVRYTFPTDEVYQYYTVKGSETGVMLTSQYSYVYYFTNTF